MKKRFVCEETEFGARIYDTQEHNFLSTPEWVKAKYKPLESPGMIEKVSLFDVSGLKSLCALLNTNRRGLDDLDRELSPFEKQAAVCFEISYRWSKIDKQIQELKTKRDLVSKELVTAGKELQYLESLEKAKDI